MPVAINAFECGRRNDMAGALVKEIKQLFDALDRQDHEAIIRSAARDIQIVDEVARRWLRGIDVIDSYLQQMVGMVGEIHSTISDIHETVQGDLGLVTCWLEQDYTLEGRPTHSSAPTTIAFRRESGGWKALLFHSVTLPPEET